MKSPVLAALVLSASLTITVSGQVKSVVSANNQASSKPPAEQTSVNATRARVLNQTKPDFNNHSDSNRIRRAATPVTTAPDSANNTSTPKAVSENLRVGHSSLKPAGLNSKATTSSVSSPVSSKASVSTPIRTIPVATSTSPMGPTQVYRVGPGDVLDIQLADNPGRSSTLFTVLDDGVLEYPLAGNPVVVGGMTTPEIAALLRQRIKIFDDPKVKVDVRDYASHAVSISGFVAAPGTKILRREAMPLYTMLAEALVLPEAARATITREGQAPIIVDLKDTNQAATLVVPGDAIKVSAGPSTATEFFFVGGEITSPGQKSFHAGLTLTQAILASGGTTTNAGAKVKVSRQGADGRLSTEEFNLRKIQTGKTPDPVLQQGDRIEVTTGN
jgi:protein involved in polysaccharide export with SLBB domain